ncbi:MAG: rhodanese-like domain-containing protein [Acidimicrobiales bacterium]|nr:rhodanese-like domain-containing protein [Acidimicrobiales bacterium]
MGLFNRSATRTATALASPGDRPAVEDVSVDRAAALHASGVVLLDVREADEWHAGHAPKAVHLPLSRVGGQVAHLRKASHVLVICRAGGRSRQAAELLAAAGVRATNVLGGMQAWGQAGHPMTSSDGARPAVR